MRQPPANIAPMRIAIDARLTHYTSGGIARYIHNLVTHLPSLAPTHHFTVLQSRKQPTPLTTAPNSKRHGVWTPAHHKAERIALAAEVLTQRPHILHSPDFIAPLALGWKRIITIHDLAFLRYPEFMTAESRAYYNAQIQRSANEADAIIVNSQATKAETVSKLGVAPAKVTVTHLAPAKEFSPAPSDAIQTVLQRYDLPEGYLLYVGTFEPRKNVPGLLEAYAIARKTDATLPPLVLVGNTGWLFDDVRTLISKLGLEPHLHFVQDIAGADLPAIYSGATLFVLVSHYEGFGLPVLEAMACGTAVITSNVGALPEVAGQAAKLVDPLVPEQIADAIVTLYNDAEQRKTLETAGFENINRFSWQQLAQKTLNIYNTV